MVKSFLADNKITFKEVNIVEDKEGRDEMVRKSGRMVVPIIDIDGDMVIGFDQTKLKEKLGIN
jgi:glutaredoxin 3